MALSTGCTAQHAAPGMHWKGGRYPLCDIASGGGEVPPPALLRTLRMPAAVRMPACHSRRFKGERPIGAATG